MEVVIGPLREMATKKLLTNLKMSEHSIFTTGNLYFHSNNNNLMGV